VLAALFSKTEEEIFSESTPLIQRTMLRWNVVKFELRQGSLAVLIEMSATWILGWMLI